MKLTRYLLTLLLGVALVSSGLFAAPTPSGFASKGYRCYAAGGGTFSNDNILIQTTATVTINGANISTFGATDLEFGSVYTYVDQTVTPNVTQIGLASTNQQNYLTFEGGSNLSFACWGDDDIPAKYIDGYATSEAHKVHILNTVTGKIYKLVKLTFKSGTRSTWGTDPGTYPEITSLVAYADAEVSYPANNAKSIPTSFNLAWTQTHNCDQYEIELATNSSFTANKQTWTITNHATLTQAVAGLTNNTVYYWRVRAKVGTDYTDWNVGTFLTALSTPAITSPTNNFTGFGLTAPKIYFNTVTSATSYTIVLTKDGAPFDTYTGITTSPYTLPNLDPCSDFTATIQAIDGVGGNSSLVSTAINFSTVPGAPNLNAPADAATALALLPNFSWATDANSNCATKFTLEIETAGGVPVFSKPNITLASYQLLGSDVTLSNYTNYRWRITPYTADGTGTPTAWRTFRTLLGTATGLVPAHNAVQVDVKPSFSWNAVNGATSYDFWFGPNSNGTSPTISVNQVGTTYTYAGADLPFEGVYYWGVTPKAGAESAPYLTPNKFTTRMDTPVPTYPAANEVCIPLSNSTGFQWTAFAGATSYELQYKLVGAASWTYITNITQTNFPYAGLQRNQAYQFRVQAIKGGIPTDWSLPNTFYTIVNPVVLTAPADDSYGFTNGSNIDWDAVTQRAGVPNYDYEVSSNSTFTNIVASGNTTSTLAAINGLTNGTKYWWRVTSSECGGDLTSEAMVYTFTTLPGTPLLNTPVDMAIDQNAFGTLTWSNVVGSHGYQIYIDDNNSFTTPAISTSATTTVDYSGLDSETEYFWKVRAYQTSGGTTYYGSWSSTFAFTTKKLGPPQIAHPLDGSDNVLLDILLEWNEVPGAAFYGLQVSKNPAFPVNQLIVNQTQVFHEYWTLPNLEYGTTYYWRLYTAVDDGNGVYEYSAWSPAYDFSTIPMIAFAGDFDVCSHELYNDKVYTTQFIPGVDYAWVVTGGNILPDGDATDNSVTVNWTTPGTGTLKVTRSADHWLQFTDTKTTNVVVGAVKEMDVTIDVNSFYPQTYCVNERIYFSATLNELIPADVVSYKWTFENVDGTMTEVVNYTPMVIWNEKGTYTVKFYAVSTEPYCEEFETEFTIDVVETCPITLSFDNGFDVCKGAVNHQFETYIFGGDGGDVDADYIYNWTPSYIFLNNTVRQPILTKTNSAYNVTLYAWDRLGKQGTLSFKIALLDKPLPDLESMIIVPNSTPAIFDLENTDPGTRVLIDYGCYGNCASWTWEWLDRNYTIISDYNNVALPVGINKFYLQVTNDQGCKSDLKRTVVYKQRAKETFGEPTAGANAAAFAYTYPNPTVNELNITADLLNESAVNISIVDINGKTLITVPSFIATEVNQTVNVQSLPSGSYFVIIETNDDTVLAKFIKQ